jgi:hypothetical protein
MDHCAFASLNAEGLHEMSFQEDNRSQLYALWDIGKRIVPHDGSTIHRLERVVRERMGCSACHGSGVVVIRSGERDEEVRCEECCE